MIATSTRQAAWLFSCLNLLFIAVFMCAASSAFGAVTYIDATAKTGLPDVTQHNGGICGTAAMVNTFWNWSNFGPFKNATPKLVAHTKPDDFAFNWGADSDAVTEELADIMYGPVNMVGKRTGGLSIAGGAMTYFKNKGQAYNKEKYPNGLSIEHTFGWGNITYSKLNTLVQAQKQNAVLGFKWYQADGTFVTRPENRGGEERYHAVTLTGIDDTAKKLLISNPWEDHADVPRKENEPNPPVSVDYYDTYTLDATEITNNDMVVIKKDGSDVNAEFVTYFDNDNNKGAYMRPVELWQVKKGGSPNVVGSITDSVSYQQVRYVVENPDSVEPISNAYIMLDPQVVNISLAYLAATSWLAAYQPNWSVSILDPNSGVAADMFTVTGEDEDPSGPGYQLAGWQSGAAGLVFSTSSPSALLVGDSVTLGFDMPGFAAPELWSNVYAAATADSSHSWWGVWGVQVPEPGTIMMLAIGSVFVRLFGYRLRRTAE